MLGWSMLEVALVAAYCELEAEQFRQNTPGDSQAQGAQRIVYHAAPKVKP